MWFYGVWFIIQKIEFSYARWLIRGKHIDKKLDSTYYKFMSKIRHNYRKMHLKKYYATIPIVQLDDIEVGSFFDNAIEWAEGEKNDSILTEIKKQ